MNFKSSKLPLLVGTAMVLIAGCEKIPDNNEAFFEPTGGLATHAIMDRQADIGAARDGTLYAFHFDGDELNSLGRAKLDQVERGTPLSSDVQLFVDLDVDDAATAARKAAVSSYLDALGLPTDRVALVDGPNPKAHPVGKSLGAGSAQLGPAGNDTGGIGGATGGGESPESSGPM